MIKVPCTVIACLHCYLDDQQSRVRMKVPLQRNKLSRMLAGFLKESELKPENGISLLTHGSQEVLDAYRKHCDSKLT